MRRWFAVRLLTVGILFAILLGVPEMTGCGRVVATSGAGYATTSTSVQPPTQTSETSTTQRPTTTSTSGPTDPVRVGTSVEGRAIELFKLGLGKTRILVIGGVHGDETGGEVARKLLERFREHPQDVPEEVSLSIIPSANPDGEAAGTRGNANRVDVNRNFPSDNWLGVLHAKDRPTGGLTGGAAPASEPETKALIAVLAQGWDLVIALHAYGGIVDYNGEGGLPIAKRISAIWGKPVQHLAYQQYITGSLGVYMPERYGVPVVTIELNDSLLTPELWEALLAALAYGATG